VRGSRRRQATPLRDHVDNLIEGWAAERPDLDTSPIAVVYRLTRVAAVWNAEIDRLFASYGITSTDFAVLSNLQRAGAPYQLNQRLIMSALRLTSGTVSLRIEKMVERGLVTRSPDPMDARASVVTLTADGAELFDRVAPEHLANEARLIAALPAPQLGELSELLRAILIDIEQPAEGRPDHRLGFVATPAPTAQRKRSDLGLPPQPGLLVASVLPEGPAAQAGIRPGDTIVELDGTPLHSLACLERTLDVDAPRRMAMVHRAGKVLSVEFDHPR
jgi:DNA-binding MarR family transcriptional regulator